MNKNKNKNKERDRGKGGRRTDGRRIGDAVRKVFGREGKEPMEIGFAKEEFEVFTRAKVIRPFVFDVLLLCFLDRPSFFMIFDRRCVS